MQPPLRINPNLYADGDVNADFYTNGYGYIYTHTYAYADLQSSIGHDQPD